MNTENEKQRRKKAQRLILIEHVFNTLADRMWLYAAGLLLIDATIKQGIDAQPIFISSLYGLFLELIKVVLVGPVGNLIEKTSRLKGAITALVVQNGCVAISASVLCVVFWSDLNLSGWGLFGIITSINGISILASVGLMNSISRDYAVEISTPEELTGLNSKLRGIDQASLIFASGLAGLTVSYDKAIGSAIIGGFNILAMIVQVTMLYKVHKLVPELSKRDQPETDKTLEKEGFADKMRNFVKSWELFVKSRVFIPGLVLSLLYLNILGLSFPLQGFLRQSCLSEATISIIYICAAISGFIAPLTFPILVKGIKLVKTGVFAGIWQSIAITISIIALYIPSDSAYDPQNCTDNMTMSDESQNNWNEFFINCPKDENGVDAFSIPSGFVSIGLIVISAVTQRWGVYLFDMVVTQLFQITIEPTNRNRVAAGQYSMCSIFSICMYFFGLIWTNTCDFGTGIIVGSGLILTGYAIYFIWAATTGNRLEKANETGGGASIWLTKL